MKYFNTSGPNIPSRHYTIERVELVNKGIKLVKEERYFTIWAPRQTGKSTYFRQLAEELEKQDYKVAHINFENYKEEKIETFIQRFKRNINEFWKTNFEFETIPEFFELIETQNETKNVLIIDEVEGINKEYFGQFLHSIRNAYHSREKHCLKSVILVGVSNILGVISDNASPFNIADNLDVPYFTDAEVFELLGQHETETGQLFEEKVKQKIIQITANQPGLVNGFAKRLVDVNPDKKVLDYQDYLKAEHWYLNLVIDKNVSNILNKAKKYRKFLETLLFTESKIPFKINREEIKYLYSNGLIKDDGEGYVEFWVPIYKKAVYDAFYPYTNGEKNEINLTFLSSDFQNKENQFQLDKLVENYKIYVKRRGFKVFLEKDKEGSFKSIKESALIYSFETFITAIIQEMEGKIYREADTGLGKSDMIIHLENKEYLIETKVYSSLSKFTKGKKQLAYYAQSLALKKTVYLVFLPKRARITENIKENIEIIDRVEITTYLIKYDEEKW